MFREGQQIGLYTLIRKLGRGGFGEVWLAERKSKFVTTKVAVKLPHDEQVDHEAIKQEAQLWEQASGHPNILPIIDADEYDGQIVIVSEYAPDGSLEQWLQRNGKMPVERAIETTMQILDGLKFLHSRNIIHRDLKPANILLQGSTPRLADFGISRALRTTVASQSQNISGTFAYMSPEALDGKRSVQTDVWSVGVNLYQFLTGTLPFPHKEPSVLFPAIIMREFAPLPDSIPQSLKNVIAKALAKMPENRYASAGAMREDLKKVLVNVQFPQFMPKEILPKVSLLETITAPVTIESETVIRKAKIPEKLAEVQHQRESKKKRRAELKRKQSEAEIQQQDELERQRWQAAEVKRKEEIKRREAERKEEKKRHNQEYSKWARRQKTEEEQKTLEEMIGREAKRQEEIKRFVKVEAKEKEQNTAKKSVIGIGVLAVMIFGGLIWTVSSNLLPNVATNKLPNTPSTSSNNPKIFKNSIGMEFVKIPAGNFMMGSDKEADEKPIHKVNLSLELKFM